MKSTTKILIAIIVVIALVGIYVVSSYNSLITKSEEVDSQWSIVESKLQRRYDLIPNLVQSVKGIMKQEETIFGKIADARSKMAGAKNINERINASNELEGAIGRLLVVIENYPQLKSSENVNRLMDELAGAENRISVERDRYNALVKEYNQSIKKFPLNIIANSMGFEAKTYFKANEKALNAPKVNF